MATDIVYHEIINVYAFFICFAVIDVVYNDIVYAYVMYVQPISTVFDPSGVINV